MYRPVGVSHSETTIARAHACGTPHVLARIVDDDVQVWVRAVHERQESEGGVGCGLMRTAAARQPLTSARVPLQLGQVAEVQAVDVQAVLPDRVVRKRRVACDGVVREPR